MTQFTPHDMQWAVRDIMGREASSSLFSLSVRQDLLE